MYIGDQPIESTVGGPALLYRLLQTYPTDRLLVVESNLGRSAPTRRLAGVRYESFTIGWPRLLMSRFKPHQAAVLHMTAPLRHRQLHRLVSSFRPDAVLGISHMYSWQTAAAVAKRLRLPLHLILHDDCVRMSFVPRWLEGGVAGALGKVYRQAASRLCIAPMMEAYYRDLYGVGGSIVPPSWAADAPELGPVAPSNEKQSLTFAYAGSLHRGGYAGDLSPLARVLQRSGHRLMLFTAVKPHDLGRYGLNLPNVIAEPTVPYQQLIERLRKDADVLVAPMSFEPRLELDMKLCFPSKLADYTAVGLPLLVWGPAYCSAADWAIRHPGIGEVVTEQSEAVLAAAVTRLEDPEHRRAGAVAAAEAGLRCFSHRSVFAELCAALQNNG